ncbi:hypothetical protein EYF80_011931 [Liparis tanakae]|uniref:Uncharacterized protein n=1 Tax=Liparis tanakae TaxID=230148 RepID=A0A4Z2IK73_9TELE|nr:hypothetical protein EYF80_011931 [Liparis tanakae]
MAVRYSLNSYCSDKWRDSFTQQHEEFALENLELSTPEDLFLLLLQLVAELLLGALLLLLQETQLPQLLASGEER